MLLTEQDIFDAAEQVVSRTGDYLAVLDELVETALRGLK